MKKILFTILILLIVVSVGCQVQEVTCNKPYIKVGTSCCLDQNDNSICDNDETTNLKENDGYSSDNSKIETKNSEAKHESNIISSLSLSDRECIDELTFITAAVNVVVEEASNIIYDLNYGRIILSKFSPKLTGISQEFSEVEPIIKSKNLDTGCSTEIKNKVINPLISVSKNYALGYKKTAAFSSKESLQLAAQYITNADNEKAKIESYLLSHQR